MNNSLINKTTSCCIRCEDLAETLVVDKFTWNDSGEIDYNISIQDSYLHKKDSGLWHRLKKAFKVLFGKPVYYADLYITEDRMKEFVKDLNKLID